MSVREVMSTESTVAFTSGQNVGPSRGCTKRSARWTYGPRLGATPAREPTPSPTPPAFDAESAWRALLDGKLAFVDRFDRDGRRFVVARATQPDERDALTVRERQVLASIALGHANKRIALDLGVSESTVSATIRAAA